MPATIVRLATALHHDHLALLVQLHHRPAETVVVRRLDDAVAAARTVNLAQGAGLAVGGLVCCGVALGYDCS